MKYVFQPMNRCYADEIAYGWKYEGIYAFYDMTADEEDLSEFTDERNWPGQYYTVLDENGELIGYYSYAFPSGIMWIGFGLRPDLNGKGLGAGFVEAGIAYGVETFAYRQDHIMLAVASFNVRAITVYEKLGFQAVETYMQNTNGGEYEFIKMKKAI